MNTVHPVAICDSSFINWKNCTNSSRKLLEKIVNVALILEERASVKFPSVNFNCWRKRRILLFSALKLISLKFGIGSKLFQLDWLIEILSQIICKVSLKFAAKILKIEGGLKKLWEDLRMAAKLQTFQILRVALRKEEQLKLKLAGEEVQNFLFTIERRKKQQEEQIRKQKYLHHNKKLEEEIANLRLEDPENERNQLRKYLHAWRCVLNLRLVKERTRKRFKTFVIGKWRKSTRVSTIAGIYYGKKVKLRSMNRWFSKKFGRSKEYQLTLRLNDFVARKKRRAMFLTKEEVTKSHALTAKGLFHVWRDELQGRRAEMFYSSRLALKTFRKLSGNLSLIQGKSQTSRLYNEIRLLKNFFYSWFSNVIPDRFVFARDRMILSKKEKIVKSEIFKKWLRKSRLVVLLEQQCEQVQIALKTRKMTNILVKWNSLTKQHAARLIWTENFRITEDLRSVFNDWRLQAKNQVISDTKYQFNLCKNALKTWRELFDEKQENRFQLKRFFVNWKSESQGRRGIRFLEGQKLLRRLTRLKASNSTLSKVLEFSTEEDSKDKILMLYRWKMGLKRIKQLEDCGNVFLLEKIKKILQIWRLRLIDLNLIENEPMRLKMKFFGLIKKSLQDRRDKCESLDGQLFHYYTNRAIKLESFYFHLWESAFQITQVGENCCNKVLKLWETQKRKEMFKRWQVQTAGIIFGKCKQITEQQEIFSKWRQSCSNERNRRSLRIVSKHFQFWCQVYRQRTLENREINYRHERMKLKSFNFWKLKRKEMVQNWSRANDFFFIVRGSRSLDLWKQKLESLRSARTKTQTLLLLRAPIVRKPRIEQLMATAVSLSDLKKDQDDSGNVVMGNLNIAELSV